MSLKETIRRVLKEEMNANFFLRRVDLDKVRKILPVNAKDVYHQTKDYGLFKFELTLRAVESILWNEFAIGWEDLSEQEEIDFVTKVSELFDKEIKYLYNKYDK